MHIRILFLLAVVTLAMGQFGYSRKPGACPPFPNVGICERACSYDDECVGRRKCCRTACGGTFCTSPVTQRRVEEAFEKPGSCPQLKDSKWVCSSRCSVDSDCRGRSKCCRNRCGALACMKPAVEESNDVY